MAVPGWRNGDLLQVMRPGGNRWVPQVAISLQRSNWQTRRLSVKRESRLTRGGSEKTKSDDRQIIGSVSDPAAIAVLLNPVPIAITLVPTRLPGHVQDGHYDRTLLTLSR
jgi:hypothetical protein